MLASKGADISEAEEIRDYDTLCLEGNTYHVYVIREKDEDGNVIKETYYYHNNLSEKWEAFSGDSIYTVFEQTPEGFKLRGNVCIDGSLVTSGTIAAERIDTEELACTKLYSKGNREGYYAAVSSGMGDFGIYSPENNGDMDVPDSPHCIWGVYNSNPATNTMNFFCSGTNYMGFSVPQNKMFAKGYWDFANAEIVSWGDNAPVAIFGGD